MKSKFSTNLAIGLAIFSMAFTMEVQWPWIQKKENASKPNTQTQEASKAANIEQQIKSQDSTAAAPPASSPKSESAQVQPESLEVDPEIIQIQKNLKSITDQTRLIQIQSASDRARLKTILDQVQIQKKLVSALKVPKVPQAQKQAISQDEVLRNTKVRLLAEEVEKTRLELNSIPKLVPTVKPVPKAVKIENTKKPQKSL